jgi:hypothetical protein
VEVDSIVLAAIVGVLSAFVTGALQVWAAVRAGIIELKKRKPEVVTHQCRIAELDVYTYITGRRKHTPPPCPYLDVSDYETCRFDPALKFSENTPAYIEAGAMKQGT